MNYECVDEENISRKNTNFMHFTPILIAAIYLVLVKWHNKFSAKCFHRRVQHYYMIVEHQIRRIQES